MLAALALCLGALFCLVRGASDIAVRRRGWGVAGIAVGVGLAATGLLLPLPTHAIKIDPPMSGPAR